MARDAPAGAVPLRGKGRLERRLKAPAECDLLTSLCAAYASNHIFTRVPTRRSPSFAILAHVALKEIVACELPRLPERGPQAGRVSMSVACEFTPEQLAEHRVGGQVGWP